MATNDRDRNRDDAQARQGDRPSDTESLAGDTALSRPLTDEERREQPAERESRPDANPPRTTTGKMTAPKFGSAGSGGAELEPGPEKN